MKGLHSYGAHTDSQLCSLALSSRALTGSSCSAAVAVEAEERGKGCQRWQEVYGMRTDDDFGVSLRCVLGEVEVGKGIGGQ